MIPSKRPLGSRPLPSTSLPKAALAKAAMAKAAMAKTVAKVPAKPAVAPKPNLVKSSAPAALAGAALPSTSLPKGALANKRVVRVSRGINLSLKGRSKWTYAGLAVAFLLVGTGVAYAFGFIGPKKKSVDAQLWAIDKKMRDTNLTKEEQDALEGQKFQIMMKNNRLPRGFTDDGGDSGRGGFGGRMSDDQLNAFMSLPPADQVKELDKRIDDMVQRQKDREARDAKNGVKRSDQASGGRDGRGGGGGGPGGGGPGGGGPGGGRGGRDPNGPTNSWRNRMLSSTPADGRAQRGINREVRKAYSEMMQGRADQRGISLPSGGGFGGFGGRRG